MTDNNLSQLVGALGGWMEARPYGTDQAALDRAARIVLDMRLLGLHIEDQSAPELDELVPEDRAVVEEARMWALARREELRRQAAADERRARAARVAAREAKPPAPFPTSPGVSTNGTAPVDDDPRRAPTFLAPQSDAPSQAAAPVPAPPADPVVGASFANGPASQNGSAPLADPSEHEFFTLDPEKASKVKNKRAELVFRVVLVVWAIAALGVIAVLVSMALG